MRSTRWRAEGALAILVVVIMLVVVGGAIWFVPTTPVHDDAVAVPSTAAAAPSTRYAGPVEESRRLARTLAVSDNLPGLSVAVAADGEIVWAPRVSAGPTSKAARRSRRSRASVWAPSRNR